MNHSKRPGMLLMVAVAFLWSSGGVLVKSITWNAMVISGVRSAVAAVCILAGMRFLHCKIKINRWSLLAAVGLCGCVTLYCVANKFTTAANAIVLEYTTPIFILLIYRVVFKLRLKRNDLLVVCAAFFGMMLFFLDELEVGNIVGNVVAIASGACNAVMFVALGQAGDDDDTRMSGVLLAHGLAGAVGLAFIPFVGITLTGVETGCALALGVMQLGIPYIMYSVASKTCPPLACSLIAMLEAILSPIWVMLILGERPGPLAIVGAVILIISIAVYTILESRGPAAEKERNVEVSGGH